MRPDCAGIQPATAAQVAETVQVLSEALIPVQQRESCCQKREIGSLKQENSLVKQENGLVKQEIGLLKQDFVPLK